MDKCNICGREASSPYRVYDKHGKVLNGCVAEFHTGHLVTPSESSFFHNRPEAKKIRANLKHMQAGKGMKKNPRRRAHRKPIPERLNPYPRVIRSKKKRKVKPLRAIKTSIGKQYCVEVIKNGKWEKMECIQSRSDSVSKNWAIRSAKYYKKKNPGKTYRVTVS